MLAITFAPTIPISSLVSGPPYFLAEPRAGTCLSLPFPRHPQISPDSATQVTPQLHYLCAHSLACGEEASGCYFIHLLSLCFGKACASTEETKTIKIRSLISGCSGEVRLWMTASGWQYGVTGTVKGLGVTSQPATSSLCGHEVVWGVSLPDCRAGSSVLRLGGCC